MLKKVLLKAVISFSINCFSAGLTVEAALSFVAGLDSGVFMHAVIKKSNNMIIAVGRENNLVIVFCQVVGLLRFVHSIFLII